MKDCSVICFDLDDTLWDLAPVIPRAEQALYGWYAQNYPRVIEVYSRDEITHLRQVMAKKNPQLAHDLTALRMLTLTKIAIDAGYPEGMADEAFFVFDEARNDVELYADVVPGLERLSQHFRIVSLSNGNADLSVIGIDALFEATFSARQLGYSKPDLRIFAAVCDRLNLSPEDVVHVGDHPENDIVAARQAGMHTVWVNRGNAEWPLEEQCSEHAVACLEELADLFGSPAVKS